MVKICSILCCLQVCIFSLTSQVFFGIVSHASSCKTPVNALSTHPLGQRTINNNSISTVLHTSSLI